MSGTDQFSMVAHCSTNDAVTNKRIDEHDARTERPGVFPPGLSFWSFAPLFTARWSGRVMLGRTNVGR